VKKVLISDEFEELLPRYMNFIRGVVSGQVDKGGGTVPLRPIHR
jgi:hypothetical protein